MQQYKPQFLETLANRVSNFPQRKHIVSKLTDNFTHQLIIYYPERVPKKQNRNKIKKKNTFQFLPRFIREKKFYFYSTNINIISISNSIYLLFIFEGKANYVFLLQSICIFKLFFSLFK